MMTKEDVKKYLTLLHSVVKGLVRISGSDKLQELAAVADKFILEDWFIEVVTLLFGLLANKDKKELTVDDFKLLMDTVKVS